MSKRRTRRSRYRPRRRSDLGLVGLLLAGVVTFTIGSFLRDATGLPYDFFGGIFWLGILLVTFTTVLFYLAQFVLPRAEDSDSWFEGVRMIWRHYMMRGTIFINQYLSEPKEDNPEEGSLPVSFKKLNAGFVPSHQGVAITRGNEFSRPAGPGFVTLFKGEQIKEAIDLRPLVRSQQIKANTRDGIPIETTVSVIFQVRQQSPNPERDLRPYQYDRQAIFLVAYQYSMYEGEESRPWSDQISPPAAALALDKLARHTLDQLYNSGQNGRLLIKEIGEEIKQELRDEMDARGIDLLGVGIGSLQPPPPVKEQRIRSWQAGWERKTKIQEGRGQADALRHVKNRRARAQIEIINNILQSIDASRHRDDVNLSEIIMLRMIEAMEQTAQDVMKRKLLPEQAISKLVLSASNEMRQLLEEPNRAGEEEEEAES